MKRLLFLVLMVLVAATSWGQKRTMITDKSVVREELLLNGDTLSGVDGDTLLQSPSSKKVPSTEAVSKYVNEKAVKYDNTNSGLSAITRVQAIDRLAKLQTFSTVTEMRSLLNPNIPYGARMKIASNGNEYFVQADSVEYYPVDDSLVINFSGKYVVADLKSKREFKSFDEFERESPILGLTGSTEIIRINGIEIKVTPTPDIVHGNPDNTTTTPDGFYLKQLNIAFEGENILKTSRYFNPVSSSTGWVFRPEYKLNYALSDDGLQEAVLFTGIDSTDSNTRTIFAYPVSGKAQADSTYTYSFDIKYISGSGDLRYKVDLGSDVRIDKDGEWHRDDNTFTLTNTTFVRIDFYGFAPGDSILFSRPNLGKGSATSYKPTTFGIAAESGVMYLNTGAAITENKEIRLDWFGPPIQSASRLIGDQTNQINDGLAFGQNGRIAKWVRLAEGVYHAKQIIVPQGMGLRGANHLQIGDDDLDYAARGTAIFAEEIPEDSHFIDMSLPDGESIRYNAWLTDIWFELRDTISSNYDFLHVEESQGGVFERLIFTASEDSHVGRAIRTKQTLSSDFTKNTFDVIKVKGNGGDGDTTYGIDTAWVADLSAGNLVGRLDFNRTEAGFVHNSGVETIITTNLFAQNCKNPVIIRQGNVTVTGLYTEGGGINNGVAVKMEGGSLICYASTIQSESSADSIFSIYGNSTFVMYGGKMRTIGPMRIDSTIVGASFYNVGSVYPLEFMPADAPDRIKIIDNYNWTTKESWNKDQQGRYTQYDVQARSSTFDNTTHANKMILSGIELDGDISNLIWPSSEFPDGDFGSPDSIIVKENNVNDRHGNLKAETIIYTGDDIGGGTISWGAFSMLDTFDVGDRYCFGFWVFPHQKMERSYSLFELRPYSDQDNDLQFDFRAKEGKWTPIYVTGIIQDDTGPGQFVLRFKERLPAGDSISISDAFLKRGLYPGGFVETTTTGVEESDIEIRSANDKLIQFVSPTSLDLTVQVLGDGDTLTLAESTELAIVSEMSGGATIYLDPSNLTKNTELSVNNSTAGTVTINFLSSTVTVSGSATASYSLTGGSVEFKYYDSLSNFYPTGSHN